MGGRGRRSSDKSWSRSLAMVNMSLYMDVRWIDRELTFPQDASSPPATLLEVTPFPESSLLGAQAESLLWFPAYSLAEGPGFWEGMPSPSSGRARPLNMGSPPITIINQTLLSPGHIITLPPALLLPPNQTGTCICSGKFDQTAPRQREVIWRFICNSVSGGSR